MKTTAFFALASSVAFVGCHSYSIRYCEPVSSGQSYTHVYPAPARDCDPAPRYTHVYSSPSRECDPTPRYSEPRYRSNLRSDCRDGRSREGSSWNGGSSSRYEAGRSSRPSGNDPGGTSRGNRRRGNNGVGNGIDPQPPGNPPVNDGIGTGPGNPGNRGRGRRGR